MLITSSKQIKAVRINTLTKKSGYTSPNKIRCESFSLMSSFSIVIYKIAFTNVIYKIAFTKSSFPQWDNFLKLLVELSRNCYRLYN